ncbi:MAG: glycosyltransferase [Epsilonproteobacteria bacterium]|nr:glycosyltransferase [Campylobacterota bacterium]
MNISVVIPTYNRQGLVKRAIESVINQTLKPQEIIVVDDGSSDDTKKVLQNYPVCYIYQPNQGVSAARNRGIKEAKNEWIAFLDSDDEWQEEKLQKQADFHKLNKDILFSHTGERWIRGGKEVKYPKRLKKPYGDCFLDNLSTCKIAASSVMVHKKVFDKVGYFDEEFRVCEDYDFWLRVSYGFEVGLVDEPLIVKYAGHSQLSNQIFTIDRYHIKSLLKFLDSKYANEVKQEIKRKLSILEKGAKKHQNGELLKWCKEIKEHFSL